MKLLKCENGHFYDGDKYSSCPHCQLGGPTPSVNAPSDDVTIPIDFAAQANNQQPSTPGWNTPADVTLPVSGGIYGASGDTMPAYGNVGYGAAGDTVPVTEALDKTQAIDDEVTVGIYNTSIPAGGAKAVNQGLENVIAAGWLVCIKGVNAGRDYKLRHGRNSVGRDESNGIALVGDTSVSRTEQAVVVYEPHANKFYALPGRSTSLAYLNDEVLLGRTEMKKNDVLELGKTQLMLIPCCDEKFNWGTVFQN